MYLKILIYFLNKNIFDIIIFVLLCLVAFIVFYIEYVFFIINLQFGRIDHVYVSDGICNVCKVNFKHFGFLQKQIQSQSHCPMAATTSRLPSPCIPLLNMVMGSHLPAYTTVLIGIFKFSSVFGRRFVFYCIIYVLTAIYFKLLNIKLI